MGKKRPQKASDNIDFESDNEELIGEIDQFHNEKNKVDKSSYRHKKAKEVREVLNVEGSDDEEEEEEANDSSDFDSDDGVTDNQWGRKRKDFYNTSYVDEDYGGMREEEIEEAELEEEDAKMRQKKLDELSSYAAELSDDDEAETNDQTESVPTQSEDQFSLKSVKKLNKQTKLYIEEYNRRTELMDAIIKPLHRVALKLPKTSFLRRQLLLVMETYSTYILNIQFFLNLKSVSFESKKPVDGLLDIHPVHDEIAKLKKAIAKVDAFVLDNSTQLTKLTALAEDQEDLSSLVEEKEFVATKKKSAVVEDVEDGEEYDEDGELTGDQRRMASGMIAKNASSQKTKKKKNKHAKVANRKRYKEISKRVRSQVGTIRKEESKYTGEKRGIRISTIKSTKLIA